MIKVLIIDDSPFMRKVVREMLSSDKEIEVIGDSSGPDALDKIKQLKPDVVSLDILMPGTDGRWILEEINKQCPTAVIIFSCLTSKDAEITADIFMMGAVDVLQKPSRTKDIYQVKQELIKKIKASASVDINKLLESISSFKRKNLLDKPAVLPVTKVVAIGSSIGGPPALTELLHTFPKDLNVGILVAQHMPENFTKAFALHLQQTTPFAVKVAEDGDLVRSGRVLVSHYDRTLTVHKTKRGLIVEMVEIDSRSKPSIAAMFKSVAEACQKGSVGVLLSGKSFDAADGLKAIRKNGGKTFVQDKSTSLVWGMQQDAVEAGVVDKVVPINKMSEEIVKALS
ncbi:MAG: chemotaxis-specific protein-glutamate methyltransferase CheB [Elusimicrobia bacterium]|nr:chemotaxis-specific protein-glutamate methyltransferase CheB [Candidatus Liberimonas magnetica]